MAAKKDYTGQIVGLYKVLEAVGIIEHGKEKKKRTLYKCACTLCNNIRFIDGNALTKKVINTCCSNCQPKSKSKGEIKIAELLTAEGYDFKEQETFEGLVYKGKLRFDFTIYKNGKLKYALEYDGIQHYKPSKFSKSVTDEKALEIFIEQRRKDTIKNEYCVKNGITLIRIPYTKKPEILNIRMLKPYGNKFKITKQNAKNFVDYFRDI